MPDTWFFGVFLGGEGNWYPCFEVLMSMPLLQSQAGTPHLGPLLPEIDDSLIHFRVRQLLKSMTHDGDKNQEFPIEWCKIMLCETNTLRKSSAITHCLMACSHWQKRDRDRDWDREIGYRTQWHWSLFQPLCSVNNSTQSYRTQFLSVSVSATVSVMKP